jgi:hypothetical protein
LLQHSALGVLTWHTCLVSLGCGENLGWALIIVGLLRFPSGNWVPLLHARISRSIFGFSEQTPDLICGLVGFGQFEQFGLGSGEFGG